ncbi:MAG: hypothetical protein K9H16_15420 [Bacteroidales bacterium]|nr:hypothetical protein [Bacteroidales bacterium]
MKIFKRLIAATVLVLAFSALSAQTPPPPNGNGGAPSGGNTPVGGGAPIGSALVLLITLAAGYGGKKVYSYHKRKLVD